MPFTKKSSIFACASYLFVWMIRHYRILVSDYKLNHFLYNIRKQNVDAFYRFDGYAGARLNMKFNEKKRNGGAIRTDDSIYAVQLLSNIFFFEMISNYKDFDPH